MTLKPATILSLDCATTGCSVCVWQDDTVLAARAQEMTRGQAEVLMPMIQDALNAANMTPKDLDAIAVTRGPGAFTGLRIALAAARGLALSLDIPCVGVTTLEVLAHGVNEGGNAPSHPILACVESKRADIYVQLFDADLKPLSDPQATDAETLAALLQGHETLVLVGDASARAADMLAGTGVEAILSSAPHLPDPGIIARLAAPRTIGATSPAPLYLRPPDAKLPKNPGRPRV